MIAAVTWSLSGIGERGVIEIDAHPLTYIDEEALFFSRRSSSPVKHRLDGKLMVQEHRCPASVFGAGEHSWRGIFHFASHSWKHIFFHQSGGIFAAKP